MRRVLGVLIGLTLFVGVAAPALAVERQTKAQSLNAFWYLNEPTGSNSWRQTTWYVGAFRSTGASGGTFSDLYQAVDNCRNTRRGVQCSPVSFSIGFKEPTREEFFVDTTRLDTGWIDATYDLQSYDALGRSVGRPVPTHIRADFAGEGEIQRFRESFVYEDEHFIFKFTYHSYFRLAEAVALIDGASIGETYDAYMSLSTSTESKRKH